MTCEEIKNRIVQRILTAQADQDSAVDQHLGSCQSCREFAGGLPRNTSNCKDLRNRWIRGCGTNQARILERLDSQVQISRSATIPVWRKIMKNRLSKLSIAAAMVIGISLLVYWFTSSGSSVAFADVLQKICGSSYTFRSDQLMCPMRNATGSPIKGSILEPGRMRLDCEPMPGLGAISSIVDGQSGQCLILFHQQKVAELLTNPVPNRNAGGGGFMAFLNEPVRKLWNLRNGTEKNLGKKTLDGRQVEGFEATIEDAGDIPREQPLRFTVRIWADVKTAEPVLAEMTMNAADGSDQTIRWKMDQFKLDVQMDESLFRIGPPAGYTLSHQKELKEVVQKGDASPQGKIVVDAVALAADKKLDEAIAKLLTVDWSKPVMFEGTAYIFTMTEKQYITLKPDDQQKAMQKVMDDSAAVKQIARTIREKARPMIEAGKGDQAEPMLKAGEQTWPSVDQRS